MHAQFVVDVLSIGAILKIYISQGSVVTRLTPGGIFNDSLLQIFCKMCQWKNFEIKIDQYLAKMTHGV